jgi:hypothetical protein
MNYFLCFLATLNNTIQHIWPKVLIHFKSFNTEGREERQEYRIKTYVVNCSKMWAENGEIDFVKIKFTEIMYYMCILNRLIKVKIVK